MKRETRKKHGCAQKRSHVQVVDQRYTVCDNAQIPFSTFSLTPQAQMKRGSQARRKSLREFAFAKRNAVREFRALRSARRLPQPPLRRLLKKAGENFRQTDESRLFCLQSARPRLEAGGPLTFKRDCRAAQRPRFRRQCPAIAFWRAFHGTGAGRPGWRGSSLRR